MFDLMADILRDNSHLLKDKEFQKLQSNEKRIEFILTFAKPLTDYRKDLFRQVNDYRFNHIKCLQTSQEYRTQGCKLFSGKDYSSAQALFTKAILKAPFPTESNGRQELCLAFASRSVANFQLKDYSTALFDANTSLQFWETFEMLSQRVHCLRLLSRFRESIEAIDQIIHKIVTNSGLDFGNTTVEELKQTKRLIVRKLNDTYSPFSKTISGNSDSVVMKVKESDQLNDDFWIHPNCQLKHNDRKGRCFVVKNKIPKNAVLLVERPYNVVLFGDSQLQYCTNCQKHIGAQIWPCVGCDEVVFCDEHCFTEAYNLFHKYECGFAGYIFSMSSACLHTFRILSKVGVKSALSFNQMDSRFDFRHYIESKRDQSVVECNQRPRLQKWTQYMAYSSLMNHNTSRDKQSVFYQSFKGIETALLLDYSKQLDFDVIQQNHSFIELADICVQSIRRVLTNVFGWYESNSEYGKRRHVANAFCNISSLLNHSCDPNTYWSFVNQKITVKAIKDIDAGTEMAITYGPVSRVHPFKQRQTKLKTSYHFDCNCEPCLRDCKSGLPLRCLQCNGPVVYFIPLPQEMPKTGYHCLLCGQEYEQLFKAVAHLQCTLTLFEGMVKNIESNYNKEFSVKTAQKSLNSMISFAYNESHVLLDYVRQMVRVLLGFGHFGKASQYCQFLMAAIPTDPQEGELLANLLDDLLLITNCYYVYLNESQVSDSEHWYTCFQAYERLIHLLQEMKQKFVSIEDKAIPEEERNQMIDSVIQRKSKEFQGLKGWQVCVNPFMH